MIFDVEEIQLKEEIKSNIEVIETIKVQNTLWLFVKDEKGSKFWTKDLNYLKNQITLNEKLEKMYKNILLKEEQDLKQKFEDKRMKKKIKLKVSNNKIKLENVNLLQDIEKQNNIIVYLEKTLKDIQNVQILIGSSYGQPFLEKEKAKEYLKKADKKNPIVQFYLGQVNQDNDQITEKSLNYYEKSANQGYFKAQMVLLKYYIKDKDNFSLYKKMILENPKANVLDYVQLSKSLLRDYQELTLIFIEKVIEMDSFIGYYLLGDFYLSTDQKKAQEFYKKSSDLGNPIGMYKYAIGIQKDNEIKEIDTINLIEESANHGCIQAMVYLGKCYQNGDSRFNIEIDILKSINYYKKAIQFYRSCEYIDDEIISLYSKVSKKLGKIYYYGEGNIQKKPSKSFKYYKREYEGTTLKNCCTELGLLYKNGEGVKQSNEEAIICFQMGESLKNKNSLYELGICYECGHGVGIDLDKAFYYYQEAAKLKERRSCRKLANWYDIGYHVEQNQEKSIECLKMSDEYFETELGLFYFEKKDYKKSFELLLNAMSKDSNSEAVLIMGYFYENGIEVEKDVKKAIECYSNKSKKQYKNQPWTLNNLGSIYLQDGEKDQRKAYFCFKKASELNDKDGYYNLSICYKDGIGVEKNLEEAKYYYQLSQEKDTENSKKEGIKDDLVIEIKI